MLPNGLVLTTMKSSVSPEPSPEQVAADRRLLAIIWLAVTMGVVVLAGVMGFLAGGDAEAPGGEVFFYVSAALSVAAIAGAFAVQRGLEARLPEAGSYAEVAALIRTRSIISAAVIEASALFACVAAFVTGELVSLAFLVPFFAFMFLFRPSEARYQHWLALWRGRA